MSKQIVPAAFIFAVSLAMLWWVAWNLSASVPSQDLRAYWAASKLVSTNPYDKAGANLLEEALPGCSGCETLVMRNPPWAIPFVLPLAGLEYRPAYAASLVLNLALVLGCTVAFWHICGGSTSPIPILLALSFGPAIWLIKIGQSSALPLLGITLFCWALRREWYFAAGGSLLLLALKPHLFLPLLLVVILWVVYRRKFALLAGASIAVGAASSVAIALDRHVFSQYLVLVSTTARESIFFHSLGGWLQYITGSRMLGLTPTVIGIVVAALWWWRKWRDCPPDELVPVLLLISIATSYYAYVYDHVLLLIPIVALLQRPRSKGVLAAGAALNAVVWLQATYGDRIGLPVMFPSWFALGWLVVCSPLFTDLRPRTETLHSSAVGSTD